MLEKDYYGYLARCLGRIGCVVTRFDGVFSASGAPDLHLIRGGRAHWLEVKLTRMKTRGRGRAKGKAELSAVQTNWLMRHVAAGGSAYLYVVTLESHYVLHGRHAREWKAMSREEALDLSPWCREVPLEERDFADLINHL